MATDNTHACCNQRSSSNPIVIKFNGWSLKFRNGAVRFESVMRLRNKLEELGKMTGIAQDEKGIIILLTHQQEVQILCYL